MTAQPDNDPFNSGQLDPAIAPPTLVVTTPTTGVVAVPPVPPVPTAFIPPIQRIPDQFEGAKVQGAKFLISGNSDVEAYDEELVSLDDRVRLVGEYRCVGVHFKLDPKTQDFVRVQMLKAVKMELVPWDPSDPTDNGIVRAR